MEEGIERKSNLSQGEIKLICRFPLRVLRIILSRIEVGMPSNSCINQPLDTSHPKKGLGLK